MEEDLKQTKSTLFKNHVWDLANLRSVGKSNKKSGAKKRIKDLTDN